MADQSRSSVGDLGGGAGVVALRDVCEDDLPTLFAQQLDPEANRMAAFAAREHGAFMAHWAKILADETLIKQTVLLDGAVAGNVVCFEIHGEPAVGYWIGREFWGRGVATRALAELVRRVAKRPLFGYVARHNAASIRVLEKCGFTLERYETAPADERGDAVEEAIYVLR